MSTELHKLGWHSRRLDPTLFCCRDSHGTLQGVLGTRVDDFVIMASEIGWKSIRRLDQVFVIKTWVLDEIKFCGRTMTQDPVSKTVAVGMSEYAWV